MLSTILKTLINSGLLNTTLWAAVAAAVWLVRARPMRLPRWLRLLTLGILTIGSLTSMTGAIYRGYSNPRDILQDIVAAREFAAGRPMHPDNMAPLMSAALAEEPPRRTLLWWWPEMAQQEEEQRRLTLQQHWVQAHPPFVTLITVPLVLAFGVLGTQVIYTIVELLCLDAAVLAIFVKYGLRQWRMLGLMAMIAVFGWSAAVASLRAQQLSLPLLGILVIGWFQLRRGKSLFAGSCFGLAICVKLIPVILLIPLFVRHRRAFVAAVGVVALVYLSILAIVPWSDLVDYRTTTREVVNKYASYGSNLSILAFYARTAAELGLPLSTAKAYWVGTVGLVSLLWTSGLFRQPAKGYSRRQLIDIEIAIGMCLIVMLSPITWDHSFVMLILPLAVLGAHVRKQESPLHRVLFGLLLVGFAIPDATFLWLHDQLIGAHLGKSWTNGLIDVNGNWLLTWLIYPSRLFIVAVLACWLSLMFRAGTSHDFVVSPRPSEGPQREPVPT